MGQERSSGAGGQERAAAAADKAAAGPAKLVDPKRKQAQHRRLGPVVGGGAFARETSASPDKAAASSGEHGNGAASTQPSLGRPVRLGQRVGHQAGRSAPRPSAARDALGQPSRPDPLRGMTCGRRRPGCRGDPVSSHRARNRRKDRASSAFAEPSRPDSARVRYQSPVPEPSSGQSPVHQSPSSPEPSSPESTSPESTKADPARAVAVIEARSAAAQSPSRTEPSRIRSAGQVAVRSGAAGFVVGASASVRRGPLRGHSARVVAFGVGAVRRQPGRSLRVRIPRGPILRGPNLSRRRSNAPGQNRTSGPSLRDRIPPVRCSRCGEPRRCTRRFTARFAAARRRSVQQCAARIGAVRLVETRCVPAELAIRVRADRRSRVPPGPTP